MKKPTAEQLAQLKMLNQYQHVRAYLDAVEEDYVERMIGEFDSIQVRQLQGSLYMLRELRKYINPNER